MIAIRETSRAFRFLPRRAALVPNPRTVAKTSGFDGDLVREQWQTIYAFCTQDELELELNRLQRERAAMRDCETTEKRAKRINRIRTELVDARLALLTSRADG
ncbi:MAG: hypothetical protein CMH12_18885 [Maritimibacter sp.]|nr:hypothetical protein [Maritimibacter sp.]